MSDPRLAGVGAYAPRFRVTAEEIAEARGGFDLAGIDRKAVPDADEDALTMGYEAARRALDAAGYDGSAVTYITFATTTPPMEEEDLTARLASMLGVPEGVRTLTATGSTRAGAQALDAALDAGPWDGGVGVVVASDCPRGAPDSDLEQAAGAGAGAVVLAAEGPGRVTDRSSAVTPYPGTRFREAGAAATTGLGITYYDRESFTAALGAAVAGLDIPDGHAADLDAAAVQSPDGDLPYRATGAIGVDADAVAIAETVDDLGDTGAASTLLGLARALETGADRVMLAAYGSGAGATLHVVDGSGDVPVDATIAGDVELSYAEYLRRRGAITRGEPGGGGAYVSVPSWQRTIPQRHRLVAGRCPACETLNFPPDGTCRDCGSRESFDPVALPGSGRVEAATTIARGGAPPEFVEQQARSGPYVSAVVAFDGPDGDESVSVPVQLLAGPDDEPSIGDPVVATIRRIYEQEGVIRYGVKAQLTSARR